VPKAKPAKTALGFKEQRELAALPDTIAALEQEQAAIAARLADPALYRDDRDTATRIERRSAAIEQELVTAMARWEALERMAANA
jgi:ATP-binding cassette subfamily F protein uup